MFFLPNYQTNSPQEKNRPDMGPALVSHRLYTGTESPHFLSEQPGPPRKAVLVSDQGNSRQKPKLMLPF